VTQLAPSVTPVTRGTVGRSPRSGRRARARRVPGYLFLLPGFALLVVVMVYPMVRAAIISFQHWTVSPKVPDTFVGLANYTRALHDPIFWRAMTNAAVYLVATVPAQIVLGLLCAVALNSAFRGRTAFRVMIYIPVITSWVVVSFLFRYLFTDSGLVNYVLTDLTGFVHQRVDWFDGRWAAMTVISLLGIWKGVGWSMLIFLAALQSVPREYYEAAQMDGAGAARQFWYVTIPAIRRTTTFVAILLTIGAFNVFISVQLITGGGPANLTQVPLTYLYHAAFGSLDFGYGSAIAFLMTIVMFVLSLIQYQIGKRGAEEAVA
jgi:multiple sugar transport system permease protein